MSKRSSTAASRATRGSRAVTQVSKPASLSASDELTASAKWKNGRTPSPPGSFTSGSPSASADWTRLKPSPSAGLSQTEKLSFPPGCSTRNASRRQSSGRGRCRRPKATVTASNDSSANGSACASPCFNVSFACFRVKGSASASISLLKSRATTSQPLDAASSATKPGPVATSRNVARVASSPPRAASTSVGAACDVSGPKPAS
mmetsp:Transcript_3760/g.11316  ORF Transcript_3760/g.11316 Transcript_3760/m.11316 type:complete len:204 (+) Transcript_3760:266-877(+)